MRSLTLRLALVTLSVLATSCGHGPAQRPATPHASRPVPPSVMTVSPQDMRKALQAGYRLKPDRRFLLAVGVIHSLLTGQKAEEVEVEFKDGDWEVRYANQVVGHVQELPDFPEFNELLGGWAKSVNEQHPLRLSGNGKDQPSGEISGRADAFLAPEVLAGLQEIDRQWNQGHHEAALLEAATRGFVSLVVQEYDEVEIADALAARALAGLALTKSLTTATPDREECLLAEAMGYSTHAESLSAKLAESDPARLYILREDHRLEEMAKSPGSSAEARYLWMVRLAGRGDIQAWTSAERRLYPLGRVPFPVTRTGMWLGSFEVRETFPRRIGAAVHEEISRERGPLTFSEALGHPLTSGRDYLQRALGIQPSRIAADAFASSLDIMAAKYTGPFLDPESYRAYFSAYYYSALMDQGLFYLDSLSSARDAQDFAGQLGTAKEGLAADFKVWYRHLADSAAGPADLNSLLNDLSGLPNLGGQPLSRTFNELQDRASYGNPLLLAASRGIAARLDTRIEDRRFMGDVALTGARDLKLTEKFYGSVVKAAASLNPTLQGWYASFVGDTQTLMGLALDRKFGVEERAEVLEYMEEQKGIPAQTLRKAFDQLIQDEPGSWALREKYVAYLEKAKDYAGARAVIEPWLEAHQDSRDLDEALARTAFARQLYLEGRYAEAWDMVQPAIKSQQGGAMQRGAMILNKLEKRKEAEKLAREVVARYPDSVFFRAVLAGFYWEWGRPQDAATVLKSAPSALRIIDFQQEFAPKFVEVFKERPEEQALAAFRALVAQGFDGIALMGVTDAMAEARKDDCPFQMVSGLHSGGIGDLTFRVAGYKYLKAVKGPRAALEWVRTAIPPGMYNPTTMMAFSAQEYGLLWDLVEKPTPGFGEDFAWTMRAAASAKLGPGKDAHRTELVNYYRQHAQGYWETIGRYLVGLASEDEILAQAKSPKERCENAYYLGLRAESEGRFEDASDWYRISVESGLENMGEYRWAYNTLYRWEGKRMSLKRIAAEARGTKNE